MKQTYQTGLNGEQTAEKWLCENMGMKCLERRFRNKAGEIDLIMYDRGTVVFVEVKTRLTSDPGCGIMAVNRAKQRKLTNAARLYLLNTGKMNSACRFDIIEICQGKILHVPNAFQPGGMFFR